jgi:hypothetical protein
VLDRLQAQDRAIGGAAGVVLRELLERGLVTRVRAAVLVDLVAVVDLVAGRVVLDADDLVLRAGVGAVDLLGVVRVDRGGLVHRGQAADAVTDRGVARVGTLGEQPHHHGDDHHDAEDDQPDHQRPARDSSGPAHPPATGRHGGPEAAATLGRSERLLPLLRETRALARSRERGTLTCGRSPLAGLSTLAGLPELAGLSELTGLPRRLAELARRLRRGLAELPLLTLLSRLAELARLGPERGLPLTGLLRRAHASS